MNGLGNMGKWIDMDSKKYFEPITPLFMLFHLENEIVFLLYGKILLVLKKFTKNHG
jgi:hypothetical protein